MSSSQPLTESTNNHWKVSISTQDCKQRAKHASSWSVDGWPEPWAPPSTMEDTQIFLLKNKNKLKNKVCGCSAGRCDEFETSVIRWLRHGEGHNLTSTTESCVNESRLLRPQDLAGPQHPFLAKHQIWFHCSPECTKPPKKMCVHTHAHAQKTVNWFPFSVYVQWDLFSLSRFHAGCRHESSPTRLSNVIHQDLCHSVWERRCLKNL